MADIEVSIGTLKSKGFCVLREHRSASHREYIRYVINCMRPRISQREFVTVRISLAGFELQRMVVRVSRVLKYLIRSKSRFGPNPKEAARSNDRGLRSKWAQDVKERWHIR